MRVGLVPRLRDFFSLNLKQRDKTMKIDTFGYKKKHMSEESGIAVIMSLGFMAVILILVLSFVDLSIINRRMSENYNHLQAARMATQTAYQRALVAIDAFRGDSSKDMMKIFSYNSNVNTRSDGLDNLIETVVNGVTYYSDYDPLEGPHWQYLPIDHGTDTPITARFAYAVVVDIGRIDPSSVVDSGSCANDFSNDAISETNATYTGTASDGTDIVGRPGRDMTELYLTSLSPTWFTNDFARDMGATNTDPSGELSVGSRWDSFDTIFTELGITDDLIKDSFRNAFVLNNLADAEAFWIDNGDLQRESGELYHRFNLARTDWNQIEVDSILTVPLAFNETTNPSDIYSIYWLKKWEASGGFASAEICSKQIAANLIDYCDSDDSATTDDQDNPTYVGLEKVPYINELFFSLSGQNSLLTSPNVGGPNDGKYYNESIIQFPLLDLELINMYTSSDINTYAEVSIAGSYNWALYNISTDLITQEAETFDETITIPIISSSQDYDIGRYSISVDADNTLKFHENYYSTEAAVSSNITDFTISSLKVKLLDSDSNLLDYAFMISSGNTPQTITADGIHEDWFYDTQINDPRQNLLETDWTERNWSTNNVNSSIDAKNSISIPQGDGVDSDLETASEPWEVSTAYIRNAPMESPWELGVIHRGAPWQTINLKKYRTVSLIGTGGGNEYSNGDANILDQVKMSSDNTTYGKININTNLEEVLKILFQEIYVGSDIGNSNGPGDTVGANKITSVLADQLADSALIKNGVNGGEVFFTRSQILRNDNGVPSLFDDSLGLIQTTDATQEEIMGKFINLSKAAVPDFYSIIAIGQTIKDTGNGSTNAIGTYVEQITGNNSEGDEILSTQKVLTTIQWDEQEQEFRIIKYEYLDD